jgi:hypothetical protein
MNSCIRMRWRYQVMAATSDVRRQLRKFASPSPLLNSTRGVLTAASTASYESTWLAWRATDGQLLDARGAGHRVSDGFSATADTGGGICSQDNRNY